MFKIDKYIVDKEISSKRLSFIIMLFMVFILRAPAAFADFCQADINIDGEIDAEDLKIMQDELDRDNCFKVPCRADLNGDGKVDGNDGEILIAEFGQQDCFTGIRDILREQTGMSQMEQETPFDSAQDGIEPPESRFIDNGDGTVTDPKTDLTWTKNANLYGDTLLFHKALDYIDGMNEGDYANFGYSDWRLPSLGEIRSLIDYTRLTRQGHTVPLGHPFDNIVQSRNLTISYLSTTQHTWFVSLYCRLVGHNVDSCYGYVWPVCGG